MKAGLLISNVNEKTLFILLYSSKEKKRDKEMRFLIWFLNYRLL
jgi:hypothetical protein